MRVLSLKIEALSPSSHFQSWLEMEFSDLMGPQAAGKKVKNTECCISCEGVEGNTASLTVPTSQEWWEGKGGGWLKHVAQIRVHRASK